MKKDEKVFEYVTAYFTYNFKGKKRLEKLRIPAFKVPRLKDGWENIKIYKTKFKKVG